MAASLTPAGRVALVGSTAPGHKARGVGDRREGEASAQGHAGVRPRRAQARPLRLRACAAAACARVAVTTVKSRKAVRRHLRRAGLL